ncbi:MAG: hypothetical protein ACRDYC_07000 [Acidimicrobiales bacterium]
MGQGSAAAPALTTLGGDLAVAYIGAATSRVEVVTSPDATSWSSPSITGQSSHVAPGVAVLNGTLWVAFVGEATGHVELVSWDNRTTWTSRVDTGQPTKLPPAIAVFDGKLWIASVNSSTGLIDVMAHDGQTPAQVAAPGQKSRYGPALTAFDGALWLAYIGEATGHLELITCNGESAWSSKIDTGRSSQCSPALTTIPAAVGPNPLVGSSQYVLTSTVGIQQPNALPPLLGVAVQITITDDLKFNANVPLSFQLNCYSPTGNKTLGVQQYVLMMQPNSTELLLHIQNFPPASTIAAYAGNSASILNFPNLGLIPAGWTFNLQLQYATDDDVIGDVVSGMSCTVTKADGTTVGSGSLSALGLKLANHPGNSDDTWLAPIVAMELDVVAYAEGQTATFSGGHGFVVYSSSLALQANPSWSSYVDSPGEGTSENSNCVNGLIPVGTTFGTVQCFGFPHA